jgi:hypothetical protein
MDLINHISALDDEDFRDLVDRDLRRKNSQEEADALRSPALVDRWHTVLVAMTKSVDGQLSAKRHDFEAHKQRLKGQLLETDAELAEARRRRDRTAVQKCEEKARGFRAEWAGAAERYAKERAATLRFKSGLDETLVEARLHRDRTRDRLFEHVVTEERNRLATRVRKLETALQEIARWDEPSSEKSEKALAALEDE